jgi:hypothetical protein
MTIDDHPDALEDRIAALTDALERCRKISVAAKILASAGATFLAAMLLGLAPSMPSTTIAAMAAVLGGIVLLGSNASTWEQTEGALAAAHAVWQTSEADDLKDDLEPGARPTLRLVGGERPTLH